MANFTLEAIRTKVRRLTRSPSENILPTSDIDEYINTFVEFDFPEHIQLFPLHTTFEFFTQPNVDTYVPSNDPADPLYLFTLTLYLFLRSSLHCRP
jgi:hypothetical protein